MDNRRDLYDQMPRHAPKDHVFGLPEGIDAVRRAMLGGGYERDALGNVTGEQLRPLTEALADVRRDHPALWKALDDFSADYENPLEAIAGLVGDPREPSDAELPGNVLSGIPLYR